MKRVCANNALIKSQEKVFAITGIIRYWLENIFFPAIEYQRSNFQDNAVLILDGFSCHQKALSYYDLESLPITPVYLVPHASHLT